MKKLTEGLIVTAIFLTVGTSFTEAKTIEEIESLSKEVCKEYHIEPITLGTIKVYDITCKLEDGDTNIYQFVPEQLVMTHFIER